MSRECPHCQRLMVSILLLRFERVYNIALDIIAYVQSFNPSLEIREKKDMRAIALDILEVSILLLRFDVAYVAWVLDGAYVNGFNPSLEIRLCRKGCEAV